MPDGLSIARSPEPLVLASRLVPGSKKRTKTVQFTGPIAACLRLATQEVVSTRHPMMQTGWLAYPLIPGTIAMSQTP